MANSLPWAVAQAESDPNHTDITILAGAGTLITLDANLVITTDVTITGLGASALTVVGSAAAPADAVFTLSGAGTVTISGMTIAPSVAGNTHGIDSTADSLLLSDLSLDGFTDDNIVIDGGSLEATDIMTINSKHDGFSYVSYVGGTAVLNHIRSENNGDYAFVLGMVSGTLDASDLVANTSGGGILMLAGDAVTSITGATVTGNSAEGVRLIAGNAQATLTDVTSTGNGTGGGCGCGGPGFIVDANSDSIVQINRAIASDNTSDIGAGIYLETISSGASVVISGSTVSGNHAIAGGGGVGGGIAVDSFTDAGTSVSIVDSTISGNDAEDGGGGLYLNDLGAGAATEAITIQRTTIDGNTADYGAGLLLNGSSGTSTGDPALTLQDSTVSGNIAAEEGGGLYLFQDAQNLAATVLLQGTTVSGNSARGTTGSGNGGAIYIDSAGPSAQLAVRIEYSTIAANDPPGVGGVYVNGTGVDLSLLSSILAANDRGDLSFDPAIASFTALWSLVQDASLAGIPLDPADGNIVGADPKLGPLANNGGPTKTMLIAPGSPAFDAGDPAFAGTPTTDQRGQGRVYQRIDLGAVEWRPALALTGGRPRPETPLIGMLLLFTGLALVAGSRMDQLARLQLAAQGSGEHRLGQVVGRRGGMPTAD